ncbi:suppressor of cytokine signaling 2-like [Diachasmimorpha longicaudata]|uniref:suppressor of cytokine signaling 2-like n=1 Tax=Diachasmimorpha longicaudata TaxID=58733 RepID=UPI0030B90077
MTSSSHGDVKHGSKQRKLSTRYFSFKRKTESGESTSSKNLELLRNSEEMLANSERIGFFKNFKKKLSIKGFCKSKRKINITELSKGNDSCSSERTGFPDVAKHETEITECAEMPSDVTENSKALENCSPGDLLDNKNDNFSSTDIHEQRTCESSGTAKLSSGEGSSDTGLSHLRSQRSEGNCRGARNSSNTGKDLNVGDEEEKGNLSNLSQELLKLSKYGWYWGPISGDEADAKLQAEPDGAFLIRDSSDDRYLLTLSFKSAGKLLHARVEHSGGMFSLCNQGDDDRFTSVPALIDHSMNFSKSAVFCYSRPRYPGYPAFPVRLTKPVSRFTQVRSLQYLCRFVIRQNTRLDNIHKLPLPNTIKGYIEEAHY